MENKTATKIEKKAVNLSASNDNAAEQHAAEIRNAFEANRPDVWALAFRYNCLSAMRVFPFMQCVTLFFSLACQPSWAQKKTSAKPSAPPTTGAKKPPVAPPKNTPKPEPKETSYLDGTYSNYSDDAEQGAGFYTAETYTVSGSEIRGIYKRKNKYGEKTMALVGKFVEWPPPSPDKISDDRIDGDRIVVTIIGQFLDNPKDVNLPYEKWPFMGDMDHSVMGEILVSDQGQYTFRAANTMNDTWPVGVKQDSKKNSQKSKTYNILIGGFFDGTTVNVSDYGKKHEADFDNLEYYSWTDELKILDRINELPDDAVINIIGHSYGGDTAAKVASVSSKKINILVTIDPVTRPQQNYPGGENKPAPPKESDILPDVYYAGIAQNVTRWLDVAAVADTDPSDVIARIGGRWKEKPEGHGCEYADEKFSHRQFKEMMGTKSEKFGGLSPEDILKESNEHH